MTKNADIDKYGYSGYGIGFDRTGSFSFPGGGYGENVLIFGVDISFTSYIDNKKKTLVLGICPTQGLEVCIIMEQIVIYLLMVQTFLNLKQKILKL